jgi:hypothetical protein
LQSRSRTVATPPEGDQPKIEAFWLLILNGLPVLRVTSQVDFDLVALDLTEYLEPLHFHQY